MSEYAPLTDLSPEADEAVRALTGLAEVDAEIVLRNTNWIEAKLVTWDGRLLGRVTIGIDGRLMTAR